MNQIPNIEEENAVRKEVDLMWSWVDDNKAGSKDFEVDYMKEFESHIRQLIATHHHQLQKARQDWLQEEIVRLEKDFLKGDPMHDAHQFYQVIHFNEAIQTIIDRYQAELNQDNK